MHDGCPSMGLLDHRLALPRVHCAHGSHLLHQGRAVPNSGCSVHDCIEFAVSQVTFGASSQELLCISDPAWVG